MEMNPAMRLSKGPTAVPAASPVPVNNAGWICNLEAGQGTYLVKVHMHIVYLGKVGA